MTWREATTVIAVALLVVVPGYAEDKLSPNWFAFLPEVVATVDTESIRRDDLALELTRSGRNLLQSDRETLARLMQQVAEEKVYLILVRDLLAEHKLVPSKTTALAYLKELNALLPNGLLGVPPEEFESLASQPQFQLNVMLRRYFKQFHPDWIKVDDLEIERVYRLDQQRFLLPEQLDLGVIELPANRKDARMLIERARARLLQGENFDRVATEVSSGRVESAPEEVLSLMKQKGLRIPERGPSEVLENGGRFLLLMVQGKQPAHYVSLEQVTPYLREQLVAAKVGRALEILLRSELERRKVRYYLDPQFWQDSPPVKLQESASSAPQESTSSNKK